MKVIIDCDPGHDDALALILAHQSAEVVGITTVSGNAPLEAVTDNALRILDLIGVETPVVSGASGPLVPVHDGRAPHAPHVHGESGLGGTALPASLRGPARTDAAGFLVELSHEHPDSWLVAIGPLTNVATVLQRDPGFASRLAGISIMGGSTTGGNVTSAAEFNIWADPEAADIVFRSGAEIRLCGLNLTHQFKTSDELLGKLRAATGAKARFAADLLTFLHDRMADLTGERRAALHDPCAVLAVTHPELFEFRRRPVAVELQGALTRGMTVVDERFSGRDSSRREGKRAVDVAYRIEAATALDHLLAALEE